AALLGDVGLRSRRLAEDLAQRWAGRARLLHLHLLGYLTDLGRHVLGVLVTGLQLLRDLRRNSAFGGMSLDVFDHLGLGLAVVADQLAGLVGRGMAVARRLDKLAALLGLLAQRHELLHAVRAGAGLGRRRRAKSAAAHCGGAHSGAAGARERG